jgi:hypothetical protein
VQIRAELAVTPRHDERVNRQLSRFVVRDQLESLREQRPDHQLIPVWTGPIEARRLRWSAVFRLRDDVVPFGGDPAGRANDLKVLKLIGVPYQEPQRNVGRREAPARLKAHHHATVAGVVWLDRRDLEGWTRGTGLRRLRA